MDSGHLDGRALWAQPEASVSVSDAGLEHAPVPESSLRRPRAPVEDARDRRDHATLRVLRREGWRVNHKKVERIYRAVALRAHAEGSSISLHRRKQRVIRAPI